MRSVLAVDVAAPADLVFDLVCDVERWAALFPHYVEVRPLRRTGFAAVADRRVPANAIIARYVAIRSLVRPLGLGFPIVWRSLSWPDPDRRHLHFLHLGGPTGGMRVVWTIEPGAPGCRVSIEHTLRKRLPVPLLGRLVGDDLLPEALDRLIIRNVARHTLSTVRVLAEAVMRTPAAATRESGPAGTA